MVVVVVVYFLFFFIEFDFDFWFFLDLLITRNIFLLPPSLKGVWLPRDFWEVDFCEGAWSFWKCTLIHNQVRPRKWEKLWSKSVGERKKSPSTLNRDRGKVRRELERSALSSKSFDDLEKINLVIKKSPLIFEKPTQSWKVRTSILILESTLTLKNK